MFSSNYYRAMYKTLHIYKKYHVSYRYFKKASIKKYYDYRKLLQSQYKFVTIKNLK